ncbi:Peptidase M15A [Elusimicrobium minutum Pei191]|uniref:Peptidase M15A n=1 Tax=Elusimicrobium minutum (strain Pei191) TaxID=445932 RepID=B2KD93_ELUMP|nr:D-Ala-D-Ala carboxypeptidase family metallohydrolase [Elusimicrobium minutum]ACC98489.1 Peptidase M15A [Elusimicrobium minutum Pei191]
MTDTHSTDNKVLSPHFSFKELVNTSNEKFVMANWNYGLLNMSQLVKLANFGETVRTVLGVPMIITSAIRCPELNESIGGSKTSQHMKCEAIDFICRGIGVARIFDLIRESNLTFGQLILEQAGGKEWIHISIGNKNEVMKYDGKKYIRMER